ncbi:MAG: 23S rRNA (guanosine(2251)-2'-O)-methyltransferase RlmB [Chloroflexota bacterium]|nr:23S rRNA (guanosine(2251)-2'-O)-methyltransferase RlmB [Chloroflexota bacterium]
MELLFGFHPVREALRAGRVPEVVWVVEKAKGLGEIVALARASGVLPQTVTRQKLGDLCRSSHHQNVAARFPDRTLHSLDHPLAVAEQRGQKPFLLALDHLQDPQNLGSLLRTAEAVGVHGVVLPKDRSAPVNATVARASSGAVEHLALCDTINLMRALAWYKERGVWVVGLDPAGETRYDALDYAWPVAVVVGSEDKGLRPIVRRACDYLVHIPMTGSVASLNAAVAGSLLLYHIWRTREDTHGNSG